MSAQPDVTGGKFGRDMIARTRHWLFRAYNRFMQLNANTLFRPVLATPPAISNPHADTILYSAIGRRDRRAYLLAAKSLLRYCSDVAVVVQDDGTLTDRCVSELKRHIRGVTVLSKEDMFRAIREGASRELQAAMPDTHLYESCIPVKITYLKFINVILAFRGRKVVMIDSDLLFLKRPEAILEWIEEPYERDFYGEGSNAQAESYRELGFRFESIDVANFSSGLLGVKVDASDEELTGIFRRVRAGNPSLFQSWEIEQALWSIVLGTRANPLNLDQLRDVYVGSGWRSYHDLSERAIVAHFAGAFRFKNLRYLRLARMVKQELIGRR